MKNNTSFKKFKYNWNEKMEALQKNGHSQKVILNTKKKWLSSSILSFWKIVYFMVHVTAKERWHNTRYQKRQMKIKETISIVKLGMQKQHHWICHKHHPYSNCQVEGSICQSTIMLTTWRKILKIPDIWENEWL